MTTSAPASRRHAGVRDHEIQPHVRQRQPCRLRNGDDSLYCVGVALVGHLLREHLDANYRAAVVPCVEVFRPRA